MELADCVIHPLMYQGVPDQFYGPTEDVIVPGEEHAIDFEGEYGVIVDHVPLSTGAADEDTGLQYWRDALAAPLRDQLSQS